MMKASVIVFLGPSLDLETARSVLPYAAYRPPASRGDIEKATAENPEIICLIDGVFFEQCSVGHREILHALEKGILVIGAASMGALRASETASFGMKGIGKVFELYHSGAVESDDEVAVICNPLTHEAVSEALVNMRATFKKAVCESVFLPEEEQIFLEKASNIYYPDRLYEVLIDEVKKDGRIRPETLAAFEAWVREGGAADIKREDAIAALKYIADCIDNA